MAKVSKQFYDTNIFVVQPQRGESKESKRYWDILNPGGVELAKMYHKQESLWIRFLRKINFSAQYAADIVIEDLSGVPLLGFRKDFSFSYFKARAKDQECRLGTITEEKMGLSGRRYILRDPEGKLLGHLEGDWKAYSLQLKDARGANIGKISRKADGVNPVVFTEKSAYYVIHLYIDQDDYRWRKFLLGTSAAVALLLR